MRKEDIIDLWLSTQHGDLDHRIWLRDKYISWSQTNFNLSIPIDEFVFI